MERFVHLLTGTSCNLPRIESGKAYLKAARLCESDPSDINAASHYVSAFNAFRNCDRDAAIDCLNHAIALYTGKSANAFSVLSIVAIARLWWLQRHASLWCRSRWVIFDYHTAYCFTKTNPFVTRVARSLVI